MENGDCSKKKLLCCSFPFMLSSTLVWDSSHRRWSFAERHPFHRLQFSKACSNVGSCNGLQSFGNRLLQCGFSTGSQVLPEKHAQAPVHEHGPCRGLLLHGVSLGCIFPGDMSIYCSVRSSMGCRVISAPTWSSPRTAWGKPAPVYTFAWAARETLLQYLEYLFPMLLWWRSLQDCFKFFYHPYLSQLLGSTFLPLLKYVFWQAAPSWLRGSAVFCGESAGSIWIQLHLTWEIPGLSSQTTLLFLLTHLVKSIQFRNVPAEMRKHSEASWQLKNIGSCLILLAMKYIIFINFFLVLF